MSRAASPMGIGPTALLGFSIRRKWDEHCEGGRQSLTVVFMTAPGGITNLSQRAQAVIRVGGGPVIVF